jgi:hypothetical protein
MRWALFVFTSGQNRCPLFFGEGVPDEVDARARIDRVILTTAPGQNNPVFCFWENPKINKIIIYNLIIK